ncbi:MAG: hypothetical protein ABIQ31_20890 [Ferruginibacter sp.]
MIPETKPDGLKALLILHRAMLVGQLIFAIIAFYLVYSRSFVVGLQPSTGKILQVITLIFSAAGYYAGNYLFKKKLDQINEMRTAQEKFDLYKGACLLQWILIEVPCIFSIICFLLTRNYAFFALAIVLMLLFTMLAPSKLKMILHLQLNEKEIGEL